MRASAGRCFHGIDRPASRQFETALGLAPVAFATAGMPPSWSMNVLLSMRPIKHNLFSVASAIDAQLAQKGLDHMPCVGIMAVSDANGERR